MVGTHPDEHALLAYTDGERDPAIVEHVAACPACAEQVRLLEAGRDALRSAPLLELGEERRRELVASLPERRERWAPLRGRLGPAAAAAAALVFVAGIVALATLPNGGGDEAGEVGGPALEAQEGAGGGEEVPTATTGKRAAELAAAPVRRVQGPVEEVIRLLQSQGIPAVQRDGSVVAVGARDEVRAVLSGRPRGRVAVYVR
jgi:anti-sigma factor RsiW